MIFKVFSILFEMTNIMKFLYVDYENHYYIYRNLIRLVLKI